MYVFMTKKFFVHYKKCECKEKEMIVKEIVSQLRNEPKEKRKFHVNEISNMKAVGFYLLHSKNEW